MSTLLCDRDPGGVMLNFQRRAEITARLQNLKIGDSSSYKWRWYCNPLRRETPDRLNMTLKIERYSEGPSTTIRLIGRVQAEHLAELEKQIRESGSKIVIDLEQVNLVDVQVVRFLGACEAQGITLLDCSPYIRDWISKERD
jgi:hypothetical protein